MKVSNTILAIICVCLLINLSRLQPMQKEMTAGEVLKEVNIFGSELGKETMILINQQDPDKIVIPEYMFGIVLQKDGEVKYEE